MLRARSAAVAIFVAILGASAARLSAHRLDELLESARISVAPDHVDVEMNVTPGVSTAEAFIQGIDVNKDGALSSTEQWRQASMMIDGASIQVDDRAPIQPRLTFVDIPDAASLRTGEGVARIRAEAPLVALASGPHRLVFRNHDIMPAAVFTANALVPDSERITVDSQERTEDQRELTIQFTVSASARTTGAARIWWALVVLIAACISLAWSATGYAFTRAAVELR